jgi:hypothetical protein
MIDHSSARVRVAAKQARHAPTRELAQRRSGAVEVLLLWHSETGQVEVCVRDPATGGFRIEVAPRDAMEAFQHPYAYAPGHPRSDDE